MNDIMYNAYFSNMHKADSKGTLFEDLDWRDMSLPKVGNLKDLGIIVEELISKYPGETRDSIWTKIIQDQFMSYHSSLYIETLKKLAQESTTVNI